MNINIDNIVAGCLGGGKRRIVIPGFGALIRRPDGEIAFVDILNSDDGVLAETLSRGAGLTGDEAREAVGKYSFHLKTELLHKKEVAIEGVGIIRMTPDGCYDMYQPEREMEIEKPESPDTVEVTATPVIGPDDVIPDTLVPSESDKAVLDPEAEEVRIFLSETDSADAGFNAVGESVFAEEPEEETVTSTEESTISSAGEDSISATMETTVEITACVIPDPEFNPEPAPVSVLESEPDSPAEAAATHSAADGPPVKQDGAEEARSDFAVRAGKSERELIRRLLYDDEPLPGVEIRPEKTSGVSEGSPLKEAQDPSLAADVTADTLSRSDKKENYSDEKLAEARPVVPQVQIRRPKKKKVDGILIIGIIVLVLAVAAIVYGEVVKKGIEVDRREFFIQEE